MAMIHIQHHMCNISPHNYKGHLFFSFFYFCFFLSYHFFLLLIFRNSLSFQARTKLSYSYTEYITLNWPLNAPLFQITRGNHSSCIQFRTQIYITIIVWHTSANIDVYNAQAKKAYNFCYSALPFMCIRHLKYISRHFCEVIYTDYVPAATL